jgi:3-oxoacyl-[acyl-carrier-protein] synthase-3
MDDIAVFNFATEEAPRQINEYMSLTKTTPNDYNNLVLHQANLMIMKRVAKKSGFPEEKMLVSMDRFGNTSSASIPITLVDKYGEMTGDNMIKVLCCGFGVGLSWATTAVELSVSDILPLVHTDEYYRDGYNLDDQM